MISVLFHTTNQVLSERWFARPDRAFRDIATILCSIAVLFSVAWSFLNYHKRRRVSRGKRSIVDTFTMLLFFWGFCALLSKNIGTVPQTVPGLEMGCIFIGMTTLILGCLVNICGRYQLGATWSNQISIYEAHQLNTRGFFSVVRHPLYASTIWMFLGAGIAYTNPLLIALTVVIFIPAMWHRASQEERLLEETFPDYVAYRLRTGAFFPKLLFHRRPSP